MPIEKILFLGLYFYQLFSSTLRKKIFPKNADLPVLSPLLRFKNHTIEFDRQKITIGLVPNEMFIYCAPHL